MTQNKKNVICNVFSGGMNSILSLVWISIITRKIGIESAGIFTIAYASASLFLNIGYWGMRNFQVSDLEHKYTWKEYLRSRVYSCVFMVILAAIYSGWVIIQDSEEKGLVILGLTLIKALDAWEDVYHGKYQQEGRLDIAGFYMGLRLLLQLVIMSTLILMNVSMVKAIYITFICGIGILTIFIKISKRKFEFENIQTVHMEHSNLLLVCLPICICSFLSFYLNNMSKYAIDAQLDNVMQAYYGYISMPVFLTYLFANFVYAPMLKEIAGAYGEQREKTFFTLIVKAFLLITMIGLVIVLAGYAIGIPGLQILYGISLEAYKKEFIILLIGSILYAYSAYFIVVITIMRKQNICLIATLLCVCVSYFMTRFLVQTMQLTGAAISYLLSMLVLSIIYATCILFFGIMKMKKDV